MNRNVVFTGTLTAEERAAVIRFAIELGDNATCATNCLLRPFDMTMLEKAFQEWEQKITERERAYIEQARNFDPGKTSLEFRAYFGEDMTGEKKDETNDNNEAKKDTVQAPQPMRQQLQKHRRTGQ